MGAASKIEWTEATWNPTRGCSRVSAGCTNCYAESIAARFSGPGKPYHGFAERNERGAHWTGRVELVPSALDLPLRWRRPRRVFVNSMSDLFHEKLSNVDIAAVFGVMAACPQHTFQVLTKRAERMREWFAWAARVENPGTLAERSDPVIRCAAAAGAHLPDAMDQAAVANAARGHSASWPPPNVWLGVSVEDQATADARIPHLLVTPAAIRFVSYEPALEKVDSRLMSVEDGGGIIGRQGRPRAGFLHWIIVGGESGPGARPFDLAWARATIAQCRAAGVACFVKQAGSAPHSIADRISHKGDPLPRGDGFWRFLNERKGGDPSEWSEDLRVREFPHGR